MICFRYNRQVEPPAPFVHANVWTADGSRCIEGLPALMDFAADRTIIPDDLVRKLGLTAARDALVVGFGGHMTQVSAYVVRMGIRELRTFLVEVLGHPDEPYILLGRDILNQHRITLDGPQLLAELE
jgi:hypothetical protein